MIELISLHIPKTGGRSVRRVLKNIYGDSLDLRHEKNEFFPDNRQTPPLDPDVPQHIRAIHAHLSIRQFMPIIEAHRPRVITWVREPVERLISNYYFFMKRIRLNLNIAENQLGKKDYSLLEYAGEAGKENKLSAFMEGMKPEDFFFIGLMERMDEDVAALRSKMGWPEKVKSFHANSNIDFKNNNDCKTQYKDIDESMRQEIARINALDIELYKEIKKMRGLI